MLECLISLFLSFHPHSSNIFSSSPTFHQRSLSLTKRGNEREKWDPFSWVMVKGERERERANCKEVKEKKKSVADSILLGITSMHSPRPTHYIYTLHNFSLFLSFPFFFPSKFLYFSTF